MAALRCALCDFTTSNSELVTHINQAHEGRLLLYLSIFRGLPVVSPELYRCIERNVHQGVDEHAEGLDRLDGSDRSLIVAVVDGNRMERSEITVADEEF